MRGPQTRRETDPEELIAHAVERMPYFAVPRFVEFMDGLPKTPTERIQKYLLKNAGITRTRGTVKRQALKSSGSFREKI